ELLQRKLCSLSLPFSLHLILLFLSLSFSLSLSLFLNSPLVLLQRLCYLPVRSAVSTRSRAPCLSVFPVSEVTLLACQRASCTQLPFSLSLSLSLSYISYRNYCY